MSKLAYHLTESPKQRKQLIDELNNELAALKQDENQSKQKIQLLELRIKLINSVQQLSETRLDHLEEIFKHYCTHIFKTGKHMTFQRLQYEKTHITMDRFFVFLKDFGLTTAVIEKRKRQILEKPTIVSLFKKMSSNCWDLAFQQFIATLQKMGVMYYNEKTQFLDKLNKKIKQKQRRIAEYNKKMKKKEEKSKGKNHPSKNTENDQQIGENQMTNTHAKSEQKQQQLLQQKKQQQNQNKLKTNANEQNNDDLVQQMIKDKNLAHYEDEMMQNKQDDKQQKQHKQLQNQENLTGDPNQFLGSKGNKRNQNLYTLTQQEKIQFFFKLIDVDSVNDFRKKMSQLNLPLFKNKLTHERSTSHHKSTRNSHIQQLQTSQITKELQSPINARIMQLKGKIQKKKIRQRQRRLDQRIVNKDKLKTDLYRPKFTQQDDSKRAHKKTAFNIMQGSNVTLNMVNKLSYDQIISSSKLNARMFSVDEQDSQYLAEYGFGKQKAFSKIGIQQNEKNSKSVVENLKKRAGQMEKKQMLEEKKVNQHISKLSYKKSERLGLKY